jgi:phage shock protein E
MIQSAAIAPVAKPMRKLNQSMQAPSITVHRSSSLGGAASQLSHCAIGVCMRLSFPVFLFVAAVAAPLAAEPVNPLINYDGYVELTQEVRPYRSSRLLTLREFKHRSLDKSVLLLDARSAAAFAEGHIEGAVNLPFPDFTAESLAATIGPDQNRQILIYCNNNFRDNKRPVVTKALPLALNIQTFVNLFGYGYKDVWELGEAVTMDNPDVGWVQGTMQQVSLRN